MAEKTAQISTFTCKCGALSEIEVEQYGLAWRTRQAGALCTHCRELLSIRRRVRSPAEEPPVPTVLLDVPYRRWCRRFRTGRCLPGEQPPRLRFSGSSSPCLSSCFGWIAH